MNASDRVAAAGVPARGRARPAGRPWQVLALTIACLTGAAGVSMTLPWAVDQVWVVPLGVIGVAVTERLLLHLDVGEDRLSISTTDALVALALVVVPTGWLVLAIAGGLALAQASRRVAVRKLAFNTAMYALAAAVSTALTVGSPWSRVAAATVGMAAFWLVNTALVAVVISASSGAALRHVVRQTGRWGLLMGVGLIGSGLLAGWLVRNGPWGLLGLAMPLALVWLSYDQQARRNAEAALFSEVFRAQRDRLGASPDLAAEVLVSVAARRLLAERAEVVVFTASEGPVHYRTAAEGGQGGGPGRVGGTVRRHRVQLADLDAPWLMTALARVGAVGGTRAGRPWCTCTIGDPDSPAAVLALWRVAGARRFTARELGLADLLVRQAATWLAPPPHAVPAGAGAAAMRDLRDAAGRLALLSGAAVEPAVLLEVADELHVLEGAVARLAAAAAGCGPSAAPASGPGGVTVDGWDGIDRRQAASMDAPQSEAHTTDWTTTGVLTPVLGPTLPVAGRPYEVTSREPIHWEADT